MPAPETDRAALEDKIGFEAESTAAATDANPGAFGGLFGCSRRPKNKSGRKNIFLKKNGHMANLAS